jgi:hypothetical protein
MFKMNYFLLSTIIGIFFSAYMMAQSIPTKLTDTFWKVDENSAIVENDGLNQASMWHQKTNLPFSRYYGGSFTDGDNLVISGGDVTGGGVGTNDVTTFNIDLGTFGSLPNLSTDLRLHASFKYRDSYRFLGGYKNSSTNALDIHLKYDIGTQQYSNSTPLTEGIFYARGLPTSDDEGFYILGGSNDAGDILNTVYYFTDENPAFEVATSLLEGRADGGAAWLDDNTIGYFGGFSFSAESPLQVDSIFIGVINPSDPLDITWSAGESFPGGPRARFHAYSWGPNQVIVVGGSDNESFPAFSDAWVYTYSGDGFGSWQQIEDKPTPMTAYQGGSFNVGNDVMKLVIAGGITTGPALSAIVEVYTDTIPGSTGVEVIDETISSDFQLSQNFPNPFNPSTTIQFSIPVEGFVSLNVFNALGEKVSTLVSENLNAGAYKFEWNTANLPSGIYFYRLSANEYSVSKKMILLR